MPSQRILYSDKQMYMIRHYNIIVDVNIGIININVFD